MYARGFIDIARSLIDILVWFGSHCISPGPQVAYWAFPVLRVCEKAEKWQKKCSPLDLVKGKSLRLCSVSRRGLAVTLQRWEHEVVSYS